MANSPKTRTHIRLVIHATKRKTDCNPQLMISRTALLSLLGSVTTLPEPCVVTVLDNGHVSRRRSNAWPIRRQMEPPEEKCQRYINHYSRPRRVVEAEVNRIFMRKKK